jgi:transcriptional regulator with XRE-family HTH domain
VIDQMAEARPNLMRRRLGLALRTLRQRAGLNLVEASKRLGLSGASALSKIENGKQRVPASSLVRYFEVYEVGDDRRREEIKKLAGMASSGRRTNLFNQYREAVLPPFADYLDLEELASHTDLYASEVIPGLLQTEAYAHALIAGGGTYWRTEREVRSFVELRMRRQVVLRRDEPLRLWCVLDETTLRRTVGGKGAQVGQLRHLLATLDELPHVQVQVMPHAKGEHAGAGAGSYSIFRFDVGGPVVVVEPLTTSLYLEEDAHVGRYDVAFNLLRAEALGPRESRDFVQKIIEEES